MSFHWIDLAVVWVLLKSKLFPLPSEIQGPTSELGRMYFKNRRGEAN
jgi:hypothetical protein